MSRSINTRWPTAFSMRPLLALLLLTVGVCRADSPYPYPQGDLSAGDIMQQVYYVTHGQHVRNAQSKKHGKQIAKLINRETGKRPSVNAVESYINNDYDDGITESKQLAVFRSGKLRGTGILMESFRDDARQPSITLWLPQLRKARRMVAPAHEDLWMGSVFTYGEIFLRKPDDEQHEILGTGPLDVCLGTMDIPAEQRDRQTATLPAAQCGHKETTVYHLKSTTPKKDWWYDYYLSDIDSHSFGIYRVRYFKDEQLIKTVTIDWQKLDHPDPRAIFPATIHGIIHASGQESLVIVPRETIAWDQDIPAKFWSEKTLRKMKR